MAVTLVIVVEVVVVLVVLVVLVILMVALLVAALVTALAALEVVVVLVVVTGIDTWPQSVDDGANNDEDIIVIVGELFRRSCGWSSPMSDASP